MQDGRQEPREGRRVRTLPNPRWMSQKNHPDEDLPDTRYTHMVMQFGQFLDHDLTLTPKDGKDLIISVHPLCSQSPKSLIAVSADFIIAKMQFTV